jgi:hypothetical protein
MALKLVGQGDWYDAEGSIEVVYVLPHDTMCKWDWSNILTKLLLIKHELLTDKQIPDCLLR